MSEAGNGHGPGISVPQEPSAPSVAPDDPRVIRALEEYLAAREAGHKPDRQAFLARYPEISPVLAGYLAGLEFVTSAAPQLQASAGCAPQPVASGPEAIEAGLPLGDYRLIREVGRGGMGVVYEAEQLSLGRRVALKVLPFASTLDAKQLQRFKNEAQAAAHLHHQHIVPVHATGCERGVHYYAMQFIEGHTLAAAIQDLRRLAGRDAAAEPAPVSALASELAAGRLAPPTGPYAGSAASKEAPPATTPSVAALSTEHSHRSPAFFRTVALQGVQAAEALEHAHQLGIVHRDIKPANLLVDERAQLWVTDFGLAQVQGDTKLTLTGDLLGTLRYMSPEQALAQRVVVDHRTDVYSLGVTIYELLTLEPAYGGRDRQELLRQIAFEEPQLPRRFNPAIPGELETIVLKAMAKSPEERYATAQELADDLERFLHEKPIQAKRPTLVQRAKKWVRRNQRLVRAVGVVFLLAVAALACLTVLIWRANEGLKQSLERESQALDRERNTAYIRSIALADHELAVNHAARTEKLLDLCPQELRGWEWHFLKRRVHEDPVVARERSRTILGVAFSPHGDVLASAGKDVRLWDAKTGRCLRTLTGELLWYAGIAFSPDGRRLAAANYNGTVTVCDLAANQVHVLKGHTDQARGVAFSPDGEHLASASTDQTVIVWDLRTDKKTVFCRHADEVYGVAYSRDGTRLASAGEAVQVWDVRTGQLLLRLTGHRRGARSVVFSPDDRYLATAGNDKTVRLWDGTTGSEVAVLRGHTGEVLSVAFSPDGQRLASGGEDTTVRVWDLVLGQEVLTLRDFAYNVNSVAFSADGRRLAGGGYGETEPALDVWDATPQADSGDRAPLQVLGEHEEEVTSVAFSPDGTLIASGSLDKTVRVREAATGKVIHLLGGPMRPIWGVTFSPDGRQLAGCGDNGFARVWDARTGQDLRTTKIPYGDLAGLAYSPDGRHLSLADQNGSVRVLDAATLEKRALRNGHIGSINSVAYSPDGLHLAAASTNQTVLVLDARTMMIEHVLPGHQARVQQVAYHPRGEYFASAAVDGVVVVWDATAAKEVRRFRAHRDIIDCLTFSRDGRLLATAGLDGSVKIWDAASGRRLELLRARQGEVFAVAFHPDGKILASAGEDGTVKLWEVLP